MSKFKRKDIQRPSAVAPKSIDFGEGQRAEVLAPDLYPLRIDDVKANVKPVHKGGNTSIVLTITETTENIPIRAAPLWVDGPNARNGDLASDNRATIKELLEAAGQPTKGNPTELLEKLKGFEFTGELILDRDQSGRACNRLVGAERTPKEMADDT